MSAPSAPANLPSELNVVGPSPRVGDVLDGFIPSPNCGSPSSEQCPSVGGRIASLVAARKPRRLAGLPELARVDVGCNGGCRRDWCVVPEMVGRPPRKWDQGEDAGFALVAEPIARPSGAG
ncbi:hypothetical protein FALBO_16680, partial [Fusarium albosuccineum]